MIKRHQVGSRMSQVVAAGNMVFISGQVADNACGSIQQQTGDVLAKIERLLVEAGATKSDLVNVGVFLPNIIDFDAMNSVYDAWIDPKNPPARACVEARLANPDLRIEVTAVALIGGAA